MNRETLRIALREATGCTIQNRGWPCGSCYGAMSDELTNKDWQAVLLKRGDYTEEELDNLPKDIEASLKKTLIIALKIGAKEDEI